MRVVSFAEDHARKLFATVYDLAIFGAGYASFAAATAAAKEGAKVILIDRRCDLLWESARARHPDSGRPTEEFAPFVRAVACATGITRDWIDPGTAEWVANEILLESTVERLYFAIPVAVHFDSCARLRRVTLVCREGLRVVTARQWIDATEDASVARLCNPQMRPGKPTQLKLSLFSQVTRFAPLTPLVVERGENHKVETFIESAWQSEFLTTATYFADNPPPVSTALLRAAQAARRYFDQSGIDAYTSHWSYTYYPQYAARDFAEDTPAENLALATPSLSKEAIVTLGERFMLGVKARKSLLDKPTSSAEGVGRKKVRMPSPTGEIETDVFVAGLGVSGSIAAIAAARSGVSVLAVEGESLPGGVATCAGISAYYYGCPGGMQEEIDDKTESFQSCLCSERNLSGGFHPLAKAAALQEFLSKFAVHQYCDSSLIWVTRRNDKIISALIATRDGIYRVKAKNFIDATGDGVLCRLAHVPSSMGRAGDGCLHAFTQSWGAFGYFPDGIRSVISNLDCGFVNPEDSLDMTRARIDAVHLLVEKSSVRTSNSFNRTTGVMPALGIRQGRLFETRYRLTLDDLVNGERFCDSIGYTGGHCDIHSRDFFAESDSLAFYNLCANSWRHPTFAEIPYRAILPAGLSNVWLACRAAGCDEDASNAFRMQRDMQRIGEAAGVAAAIATLSHAVNWAIDVKRLRLVLEESGALRRPSGSVARFGRAASYIFGPKTHTAQQEDCELAARLDALSKMDPGIDLWLLFRTPKEEILPPLRRLLRSGSENQRWHAAVLLAAFGQKSAAWRLIEAVRTREEGGVPTTGCYARYIAASWLLGQCAALEACEVLVELATDKSIDSMTRLTAMWSVAKILTVHGSGDVDISAIFPGSADINVPLRPWQRPLVAEWLRKVLNIPSDKTDADILKNNRSFLARQAYDRLLAHQN